MAQTAAKLLVRCLEVNGFSRAFGVPGESFLGLLDALYDSRISFITCRHEGAAAMAAAAHGQLTASPGLCIVTRGPGATNASAGLHLARQGGLPMLLLIGQVPRAERGRESFQEIDYGRMLGELTKWTAEIHDAARIPEITARAVTLARTGRPGPVALALPEDLFQDLLDAAPVRAVDPAPPCVPQSVIARLSELLEASRRPFLILGGIGWNQAASDAIGAFAQSNQVPVAFSFRAQDCLANEHECVAGPIGIGGDPKLAERVREADLVVVLGARIGDGANPFGAALEETDRKCRLVLFHPDPDEPGRVVVPDLSCAAAPADAALQIADIHTPVPPERRAWRKECRAGYLAFSSPEPGPGKCLAGIVRELRSQLPADAVLCNGAGNFAGWLHRYYRYGSPGTTIGPVSGSMGYDLPAALAAALERPDAPVVAWAGDGSFLMTGQELATAVRYNAKLTVIVIDNGQYGTIRMHQELQFPGRVSGTQITNPDFAAFARSFGAHGETARDLETFREALRRCLALDGPSLIHLPVDPKVLAPSVVLDA